MRELNVNEIEVVNGGIDLPSVGEIVDGIADEFADLVDVVNGIIDGIQGDRSNDPNPNTKK